MIQFSRCGRLLHGVFFFFLTCVCNSPLSSGQNHQSSRRRLDVLAARGKCPASQPVFRASRRRRGGNQSWWWKPEFLPAVDSKPSPTEVVWGPGGNLGACLLKF